MRRRAWLALLALTLASCSSRTTAPAPGTGADGRGTPLTGEHAVDPAMPLAWAGPAGAIVAGAINGGVLGGPGLVAIAAASGAVRRIGLDPPLGFALSADGAQVFSVAFVAGAGGVGADSTLLRRTPVAGGASSRLAGFAGLTGVSFALSGDAQRVAYAGPGADPFDPDSVRVLFLATGARPAFDPGVPRLFAPDGSQLLVLSPAGDLLAQPLPSGAAVAVSLPLPAGAATPALRWDATGVRALYAYPSHELHLVSAGGADRPVATSPDSIAPASLRWSPDGARAAFWGVGKNANDEAVWRLYAADLAAGTLSEQASALAAGGPIVFSPDGKRLAYLFDQRLFTTAVTGLP